MTTGKREAQAELLLPLEGEGVAPTSLLHASFTAREGVVLHAAQIGGVEARIGTNRYQKYHAPVVSTQRPSSRLVTAWARIGDHSVPLRM